MVMTRVASIDQFVKDFEPPSFCIGIDVHKRSDHAAIRRADGKAMTWVSPADPSSIYSRVSSGL